MKTDYTSPVISLILNKAKKQTKESRNISLVVIGLQLSGFLIDFCRKI